MIAGCRRVNACRSNALQFFAKSRQQQCHRSAARLQRRPVACAEGAPTDSPVPSPSQAAEFAKHDELINRLLGCTNPQEFGKTVAENITAFNQQFWLRIAARSDAASEEERSKLSALANSVMLLVEKMIKKTEAQLSDSSELIQEILKAGADEEGKWKIPLAQDRVDAMRTKMQKHSEALDEALLSNCFAFIKKASDDGIQEVVYALQKVLQLYAAQQLGKADAKTDEDASLTRILTADETEWDKLVEQLATSGELSEAAFTTALQKRMEQTVLGLTSGSYSQRVQAEYLKELEGRGKAVFAKLAGA